MAGRSSQLETGPVPLPPLCYFRHTAEMVCPDAPALLNRFCDHDSQTLAVFVPRTLLGNSQTMEPVMMHPNRYIPLQLLLAMFARHPSTSLGDQALLFGMQVQDELRGGVCVGYLFVYLVSLNRDISVPVQRQPAPPKPKKKKAKKRGRGESKESEEDEEEEEEHEWDDQEQFTGGTVEREAMNIDEVFRKFMPGVNCSQLDVMPMLLCKEAFTGESVEDYKRRVFPKGKATAFVVNALRYWMPYMDFMDATASTQALRLYASAIRGVVESQVPMLNKGGAIGSAPRVLPLTGILSLEAAFRHMGAALIDTNPAAYGSWSKAQWREFNSRFLLPVEGRPALFCPPKDWYFVLYSRKLAEPAVFFRSTILFDVVRRVDVMDRDFVSFERDHWAMLHQRTGRTKDSLSPNEREAENLRLRFGYISMDNQKPQKQTIQQLVISYLDSLKTGGTDMTPREVGELMLQRFVSMLNEHTPDVPFVCKDILAFDAAHKGMPKARYRVLGNMPHFWQGDLPVLFAAMDYATKKSELIGLQSHVAFNWLMAQISSTLSLKVKNCMLLSGPHSGGKTHVNSALLEMLLGAVKWSRVTLGTFLTMFECLGANIFTDENPNFILPIVAQPGRPPQDSDLSQLFKEWMTANDATDKAGGEIKNGARTSLHVRLAFAFAMYIVTNVDPHPPFMTLPVLSRLFIKFVNRIYDEQGRSATHVKSLNRARSMLGASEARGGQSTHVDKISTLLKNVQKVSTIMSWQQNFGYSLEGMGTNDGQMMRMADIVRFLFEYSARILRLPGYNDPRNYDRVNNVALSLTQVAAYRVVQFGLGDCVPGLPVSWFSRSFEPHLFVTLPTVVRAYMISGMFHDPAREAVVHHIYEIYKADGLYGTAANFFCEGDYVFNKLIAAAPAASEQRNVVAADNLPRDWQPRQREGASWPDYIKRLTSRIQLTNPTMTEATVRSVLWDMRNGDFPDARWMENRGTLGFRAPLVMYDLRDAVIKILCAIWRCGFDPLIDFPSGYPDPSIGHRGAYRLVDIDPVSLLVSLGKQAPQVAAARDTFDPPILRYTAVDEKTRPYDGPLAVAVKQNMTYCGVFVDTVKNSLDNIQDAVTFCTTFWHVHAFQKERKKTLDDPAKSDAQRDAFPVFPPEMEKRLIDEGLRRGWIRLASVHSAPHGGRQRQLDEFEDIPDALFGDLAMTGSFESLRVRLEKPLTVVDEMYNNGVLDFGAENKRRATDHAYDTQGPDKTGLEEDAKAPVADAPSKIRLTKDTEHDEAVKHVMRCGFSHEDAENHIAIPRNWHKFMEVALKDSYVPKDSRSLWVAHFRRRNPGTTRAGAEEVWETNDYMRDTFLRTHEAKQSDMDAARTGTPGNAYIATLLRQTDALGHKISEQRRTHTLDVLMRYMHGFQRMAETAHGFVGGLPHGLWPGHVEQWCGPALEGTHHPRLWYILFIAGACAIDANFAEARFRASFFPPDDPAQRGEDYTPLDEDARLRVNELFVVYTTLMPNPAKPELWTIEDTMHKADALTKTLLRGQENDSMLMIVYTMLAVWVQTLHRAPGERLPDNDTSSAEALWHGGKSMHSPDPDDKYPLPRTYEEVHHLVNEVVLSVFKLVCAKRTHSEPPPSEGLFVNAKCYAKMREQMKQHLVAPRAHGRPAEPREAKEPQNESSRQLADEVHRLQMQVRRRREEASGSNSDMMRQVSNNSFAEGVDIQPADTAASDEDRGNSGDLIEMLRQQGMAIALQPPPRPAAPPAEELGALTLSKRSKKADKAAENEDRKADKAIEKADKKAAKQAAKEQRRRERKERKLRKQAKRAKESQKSSVFIDTEAGHSGEDDDEEEDEDGDDANEILASEEEEDPEGHVPLNPNVSDNSSVPDFAPKKRKSRPVDSSVTATDVPDKPVAVEQQVDASVSATDVPDKPVGVEQQGDSSAPATDVPDKPVEVPIDA